MSRMFGRVGRRGAATRNAVSPKDMRREERQRAQGGRAEHRPLPPHDRLALERRPAERGGVATSRWISWRTSARSRATG